MSDTKTLRAEDFVNAFPDYRSTMTGMVRGGEFMHKSDAVAAVRAALAAQEQVEPVYQVRGADGRWTDQERKSYDYNAKHGQDVRVLYTAPRPAAQPLTERAILDLMPTTIPASMDGELLWFARALERAHGIGQEGGAE